MDNEPQDTPEPQDEPPLGRVRWLPFRVNGVIICQINEADPTHLRIITRGHGRHIDVEFNTKSVLSTSLTGIA